MSTNKLIDNIDNALLPPMNNQGESSVANMEKEAEGKAIRTVSAWPKGETYQDWVAEEVPVALVYNGVSHAVMMASPINLEQFALGFSFTEGIIEKPEDIFDYDIEHSTQGIEIKLSISQRCFNQLKQRRRHLSGTTGCGICGTESLQMLRRENTPIDSDTTIHHHAIQQAATSIEQKQTLQNVTGAVHAAAWCNSDGKIVFIAEDVGRHNALDKLIGQLLHGRDNSDGFILISSRISFEMVQKALTISAPLLVGISAPTTMALNEAEKANMAIVGFSRPGRHVVYTGNQRLI